MVLKGYSFFKYSGEKIKVMFGILRWKFIFIISIIFYISIALFVNTPFIGSDGRSYQRMAVNIAEGNGFSNSIAPPFEKQFFREPGYPCFFSIACSVNKLLGNTNVALEYKDDNPGYYEGSHPEIIILRILQAILASLTVLFFYKTLLFFLDPILSAIISFLFIFYLPFAIFVTFPQREILVTAILTFMGFLFIRSATSNKNLWFDILFGILAAVLVLTLQAYVFILPFFLIAHIVISKSFKKSAISATIIAGVFLLGVTPWIYRAYNEVNDLRVIKSFGVSYTYEYKKFHDANAKAYYADLDGNAAFYKSKIVESYNESGKIMFEKSYNGFYTKYADSLNNVINQKALSSNFDWLKFKVKSIVQINFRKAFFWPFWKPDFRKNISTILSEDSRLSIQIALAIGFFIGFIALFGIILFIKKTWYFLPVFTFHFLMIPLMADEGRRVLPFLPFIFMFFVLSSIYLYYSIRKKLLKIKKEEHFNPFIF
ncbi:MAG TPA: hypothetical protein DIW31_02880 [Bacteroidales bacterium]|nr:hypothetical protein [Bacteroidales bacterium]